MSKTNVECFNCGTVISMDRTVGGFEDDKYHSFCSSECRTDSLKRHHGKSDAAFPEHITAALERGQIPVMVKVLSQNDPEGSITKITGRKPRDLSLGGMPYTSHHNLYIT
jgi:hypothetical protein